MINEDKLIGRVVKADLTIYGDKAGEIIESGSRGFIFDVNNRNKNSEWYIIFENGVGLNFYHNEKDLIKFTGEIIEKNKFETTDYMVVCEKVKNGLFLRNRTKKRNKKRKK